MNGLKRVKQRRTDALARVGWDRLEALLAAYYRSEGYDVEHVGTGATGAKTDGGIDLKLRRGEQFVIVQCKHWNAMKVPHNAVHELLGLMVNHGASGAILATSGEFTKAAIEAAQKLGHVQLIDGDELRMMLGPIREPAPAFDSVRMGMRDGVPAAVARRIGERLLSAAEDRIRYGSGRAARKPGRSLAVVFAVKLGAALLFLVFVLLMAQIMVRTIQGLVAPAARPAAAATVPLSPIASPVETAAPLARADPCREIVDVASGSYIDRCGASAPPREPAHDAREQRRAEDAMRVIAESTPEL
ncbi:restriction endonuclease [Lysobacter arvi]|uniref:Restriction endonuclease n=1 Tax=Lysobacter arvi TaxID=3038776 RepID=A0ABU1C8P5_9GAMM|nr:restriction endonuclease [Lysobacter arvi]MDR0181542.1 restriction endonuclease [Lysobacter arvi]